VVEMGQTAWAIAVRYGVDLDELLALNNLPPDPVLFPGDELIIRLAPGQTPPAPSQPATHTIREGEAAWTIAANYGLTVDELLALNNLSEGVILHPGDELIIRQPPAPTLTITPTHAPVALVATATTTLVAVSVTIAPSPPPSMTTAAATFSPTSQPTLIPENDASPSQPSVLGGAIVFVLGFGGLLAVILALVLRNWGNRRNAAFVNRHSRDD